MTSESAGKEAWLKARREREAAAAVAHAVPSLHLLIWPTVDCLRLSLVIYYTRPGMRRTCTVLRQAEWRPQEVTVEKLVDWGRLALANWLQDPTTHEVGTHVWVAGKDGQVR